MRCIDVFNGDADGLCALQQLRLAEPAEAQLVTGVKRDIALLERVAAGPGDLITVLDISLERNRGALLRLLECGAQLRYFDHHEAGEVPSHPRLQAVIDSSGGVCTSMLVDRHLGGRFRAWAVTAAFGDGLDEAAGGLGAALALGAADLERLRELGRSLNYNAYGETEADLLVPPAELHRALAPYDDPLRFAAESVLAQRLDEHRRADFAAASGLRPHWSGRDAAVYVLPEEPWSRRISGTLANHLARSRRRRALAVLAPRRDGSYVVSLRVSKEAGRSADAFCRGFAGGGRREAAGIDRLPPARLEEFLRAFSAAFG